MSSYGSATLLYNEAERMGLRPKKLTEYGIFSFIHEGKTHYAFDGKCSLNNSLSSYLSQNKHATRIILAEHNLPNIPYLLPESIDEAIAFLHTHKRIVMKPTLGKSSRNVRVIEDTSDLTSRILSSSILEKYIEGNELRYLVLDTMVIAVHERQFSGEINSPATFMKRISLPAEKWDKEQSAIAVEASKGIGLVFSAVDFKVTDSGVNFILEVNSSPGIEWFHNPSEGPSLNVARMLLEKMIEETTKK